MTLSLDFSELKPLITDGCLILTPNARTQQALYTGHVLQTAANKVTVPPSILSFSQWQQLLWIELSFIKPLPKLISKQVLKLWVEDLIAKESEWNLTNESGVANKVVEAFQNMIAWNLSLKDIQDRNQDQRISEKQQNTNDQISVEVSYFVKWIRQYKNISESKNVICTFEALKTIFNSLDLLYENSLKNEKLSGSLSKKILLVGFNQFTPLESMFFDRLKKLDVEIEYYNYIKTVKKSDVMEFNSFEEEIGFAASCAKQVIDREKGDNVAVVVNQLSDKLSDVYAAFSQTFQPEENKPWVTLSKPLYNVSAGFSIAEQSIVIAGFLLLNLTKCRITLEQLHFIKNTHYFQWGNEKSATKYFLHRLCLKGRKEYSVKFILSEIEKFECKLFEFGTLSLSKLTERIKALGGKSTKRCSIIKCQKNWKKTLSLWGWGVASNKNPINQAENKVCHIFIELINETIEIKNLFDKMKENRALQYLNQLATQKTFQLPSDRSRVHVLGVLEATGLQFDHLILVGFNSINWPANSKSNPFLPSDLQRELKMPGGSAEREYEYTKSLSDILTNSSSELLITSSNENSDTKQTVSVLFSNLKSVLESSGMQLSMSIEMEKPLVTIAKYQWISSPNLTVEQMFLHGGTSFISGYASCPFSSFLSHYLKVTSFEIVESGIDARHRGVWLHDSMQLIWQQLKNKQNLVAFDDDSLFEMIESKLQSKLNEIKSILLLSVNESIISLEKDKLKSLIYEWLLIEKQRDDFSINSLEREVRLNLQGIDFTFRLDRVDLNQSGMLEIIDYKTGKVQVNDWFSVRPTEAQMPAYMLAFKDDDISAIYYARIKKGEVAQVGLNFDVDSNSIELAEHEDMVKFERCLDFNSDVEVKLSKLKEKSVNAKNRFDREELKSQWQRTLDRIAYGMLEGFIPVSPKDKNQSCTFCEYSSICRIDERQPESIDHSKVKTIDLTQEFKV